MLLHKIPVTLFGFCGFEGDDKAIERVLQMINDRHSVKISLYQGDIDKFLNEINECESIIATRFHAFVTAVMMKKNVYPIIYSPKQSNVLKDIGFDGVVWDMYSGHFPEACSIIKDCFSVKSQFSADDLFTESKNQFYALDKFIN